MAYRDDDDHDYGRHSSRHSSQSNDMNIAKTAEDLRHQYEQNLRSVSNIQLETDEKGNASIMGISVPKNLKPAIEIGLENLKPFLIDQSDKIFNNASKLAKRVPFAKAHANTIGLVAENTFRWGIIGAKQIFDVVHASSKYSKERAELFNTFSPVMQATGSSRTNNEVFRTAFNDIHADWVSDMKNMVAELPTLVPMVILGLQDQHLAANKREAAKAKAGDKIADLAKNIGEKAREKATKATDRVRENQIIMQELEAQKEKYIQEELAKGATRVVDPYEARRKYYDDETKTRFDAEQLKLIDEGKPIKVDRAYLSQEFDRNIGDSRDLLRSLHDEREDRNGHDHHEEKPKDELKEKTDQMLRWAIPGASILTQLFKANIEDSAEKRKKRVKAWKMIEHLKQEMETECGKINGRNGRPDYSDCDRSFTSKSADDIRIEGMGNHEGEKLSLKEYIVDVFQQHERDREPSRNFRDKNGKLIDPLKGTLLVNLEPAVNLIADRIADGSLSPDALYKLVGENKIVIHGRNGAKTFAKEEQVKQIIETELLPVLSTREVIKMEEFMAKFADPALIQETLKKNLEGMKGSEKALFASLFPDDILEQTGMKKKDILSLRKEAHQFSYDFVAANVLHFAAKQPDDLKKLGVSEEEIQSIQNLAERIEAGDTKALKTAVDGRNKEAIDAIRTAGLLEQAKGGEEGKNYWTERVKEMGGARQKLKENESKFAEENEAKDGDRRRRGGSSSRNHDRDGDDRKWSSGRSSHRSDDSGREDKWGGEERPEHDFSSRFDPERGKQSVRERVRKSREPDDSPDIHAL